MSEKKDFFKDLSFEFPKEAYSEDKTRGFSLTTLKAQYIRERLNKVFGVFDWKLSGTYQTVGGGVLYYGVLKIISGEKSREVESVGYSDTMQKKKENNQWVERPKLTGDVYKAAQTDSLSKCASFIGVGNDMFKGLVKTNGGSDQPYTDNTPRLKGGSFVAEVGKYKGMAIMDIDKDALIGYCTYISQQGTVNGKMKYFIDEARTFLKEK